MSEPPDDVLVIPEFCCPCAPGLIDRITEEIRSQVQAEIRVGFADLSVRLICEIQKLSYHDSIQNRPAKQSSNGIPSTPRNEFSSAEACQEYCSAESLNSLKSFASLNISSKKVTMAPWRSAVLSDIEKHDSSWKTYVDSLAAEVRDRSLKDGAFPDNCLARVVLSSSFTCLAFVLIAMNAIWMGYESDLKVSHDEYDQQITWVNMIDMMFTIWFVLELVLRIVALRKHFIFGDDWKWNVLDFVLVVASAPEMVMPSMNLTFVRLVRLAKLSRAIRLIRLVKFFTSLREILLSLFYTLGSLFWSFVALALTTYIVALSFMSWIALQTKEGAQYSDAVTVSFRNTWNTMMVLFSMISGGQEWYAMALEFDYQSDFVSKNALMYYVFFTQFGLLNVIVGVFVARAAESSYADKHLRLAKEEEQRATKVKDLIQVFREIDVEQDGQITPSNFKAYCETPEGQDLLESHGLQLFDIDKIWEVLDAYDGELDGEVDLPGFLMGMMRLSGGAKSTELVMMSKRVEEILTTLVRSQNQRSQLFRAESDLAPAEEEPVKESL